MNSQLEQVIIALPAFNEVATIKAVLEEIVASEALSQARIVVVDDGSIDATAAIASSISRVTVLRHGRNRGLGQAFRTAVEFSLKEGADVMVFFDADGQFSVNDIPQILALLQEASYDFVLGSRFINGTPHDMPLVKIIGNKVLAKFISLVMGVKVYDIACGFRAYSREALFHINLTSNFTYTQEVILDLLFKRMSVAEMPVSVKYFKDRKSVISSNLWRYGWRVFKILARTIRDYRPLMFFGFLGSILFIAGFILDIWMVWYFISTGYFSPYKFVGFSGAFLNFLGITIWFIGLVADSMNRLRKNQEEILYRMKKEKIFPA